MATHDSTPAGASTDANNPTENPADEFLKNAAFLNLGHLPTEGIHPQTENLSDLAHTDLPQALSLLQGIDQKALTILLDKWPLIEEMRQSIQATFESGHRVFLSGCGATGRLALSLESLYRRADPFPAFAGRVQALMAGGDFALVKSVENFEDFPAYGARHLADLKFREGDLLIAITEGGETPYVLGTLQHALANSKVQPWFVFCNPVSDLAHIERSQDMLANPRVRSMELVVGPMALSGSTRLQAATVQMAAVGVALFSLARADLEAWLNWDPSGAIPALAKWIEYEAGSYLGGRSVLYETTTFPIAILTDTTERSPTFSLTPFESCDRPSPTSLSYLSIPAARDAVDAWITILGRGPIGLDWPELKSPLDFTAIMEFDFSREGFVRRCSRIAPQEQNLIAIERSGSGLAGAARVNLVLGSDGLVLPMPSGAHLLFQELQMKLYLNQVSLLVMGRMGRFQGNVMTYVRPTNGKLIDRAARYLAQLFKMDGSAVPSYEDRVRAILSFGVVSGGGTSAGSGGDSAHAGAAGSTSAALSPDEPVVLRAFDLMKNRKKD